MIRRLALALLCAPLIAHAQDISAPSATPGGSNTQCQFNDSGAFGGDAGCTYNKTTDALTVLGSFQGGTSGQTSTFRFDGKVGSNNGQLTGSGIAGIGDIPRRGYGLWLDLGASNFYTAGEEIIGAELASGNSPTLAAGVGTALFGSVSRGYWGGFVDSSAQALVYGSQNTGELNGTASAKTVQGAENIALKLGTAGTMVTGMGSWSHVEQDGTSTSAITNAMGIRLDTAGINITNSYGAYVGALAGANVYGLYVTDQTAGSSLNYAIYTNAGLVRFGGAMSAPSATFGTIYSSGTQLLIGDGSTGPASLVVKGKTAQAENLMDLQMNGVTKWRVDSSGTMYFQNDLNFNSGIAYWGTNQETRIGVTDFAMSSSNKLSWSSTAHAYDTRDTSFSRVSAGVLGVGTGNQGSVAGTLVAAGVKTPTTTVSGLPSAATAGAGYRAAVSDATACTFASTPTGGASTFCPVISTGAAWIEGANDNLPLNAPARALG